MRRIGDDNKIKKVAEVDFDEWYVDESDDSDDQYKAFIYKPSDFRKK